MLAVHNLSVVLRDGSVSRRILDQVTCAFAPGALTVIAGPSGSGKSTLLSLLGGLPMPTTGHVVVDGIALNAISDRQRSAFRLREVAFVFQSFRLFAALSVRENVEMSLSLQHVTRHDARSRVDTALQEVLLLDRAACRVSTLSGGEQQRVAIARALVKRPSIVLADEPTAALDHQTGRDVFERLRTYVRERAATVVAVTHDTRMFDFADRIVTLEDGHLSGDRNVA